MDVHIKIVQRSVYLHRSQ